MIHVCPLSRLQDTVEASGARHIITLINADTVVTRPAGVEPENHLFLGFNDIAAETEGLVPPGAHHVEALFSFVQGWPRQTPLVIHCFAGISRSTAAAFSTLCALQPERDEMELAQQLRAASPSATPNPRIIALADESLGRKGRMVSAIQAIGRGADAYEGTPFRLPVR
ncbi:tyrosine phosphatase family protein [Xanthobacter sp. TB0136]|uniref:tyrosine phosphatase family protein n=1 Tax=Xanthobacter sp. TB0136 TaxID=3459177 RepID=UPI0040396BF5